MKRIVILLISIMLVLVSCTAVSVEEPPDWFNDSTIEYIIDVLQNPPVEEYFLNELVLADTTGDGIPELFIGYWYSWGPAKLKYWAYSIDDQYMIAPIEHEPQNYQLFDDDEFVESDGTLFDGKCYKGANGIDYYVSSFPGTSSIAPNVIVYTNWQEEGTWYVKQDNPRSDDFSFDVSDISDGLFSAKDSVELSMSSLSVGNLAGYSDTELRETIIEFCEDYIKEN